MLLISIVWTLNGLLFEYNTVPTLVTAATCSTYQFYSYEEIQLFSRGNGTFLNYLHGLNDVLDDIVEVLPFFMVTECGNWSLCTKTGLDSSSDKSGHISI